MGPMPPETITLPPKMAKKVIEFCDATYVNGQGDFNCFSLVSYAMGWDNHIRIGRMRIHDQGAVDTERTVANEPYAVYTPGGSNGDTAHALLGTQRQGHAFNVMGTEAPLAISKNTELLRAFGGKALHRYRAA